MADPALTELAAELGLSPEDVAAVEREVTPGVAEAVAGGLIRFEDALFELSL